MNSRNAPASCRNACEGQSGAGTPTGGQNPPTRPQDNPAQADASVQAGGTTLPQPIGNWVAIAAMGENRVIGNKGGIPWHLPEDFKFFKATTTGHVLLMGRKTWDSIGRPLPNRQTLVVSRNVAEITGATVFPSLEAVREAFDPQGRTVFVAGGETIYRQALPFCSEVLLTRVKGTFEGDTFFPEFEAGFPFAEIVFETEAFRVIRYRRAV